MTLDLHTGEIAAIPDGPATARLVATFANGSSAWMADDNILWIKQNGVFTSLAAGQYQPAVFADNQGLSPDARRHARRQLLVRRRRGGP